MSNHLSSAISLLCLIGLVFLLLLLFRLLRRCALRETNTDGEVVVQPRESGLRNQRRQDFNRFVSNYNRSFTLNNQRRQESDRFVAIQIDSFNHQLLHGNDCPPTYEDALRHDQKIQNKPPEYLELYI